MHVFFVFFVSILAEQLSFRLFFYAIFRYVTVMVSIRSILPHLADLAKTPPQARTAFGTASDLDQYGTKSFQIEFIRGQFHLGGYAFKKVAVFVDSRNIFSHERHDLSCSNSYLTSCLNLNLQLYRADGFRPSILFFYTLHTLLAAASPQTKCHRRAGILCLPLDGSTNLPPPS
jgi:hypothetical protein